MEGVASPSWVDILCLWDRGLYGGEASEDNQMHVNPQAHVDTCVSTYHSVYKPTATIIPWTQSSIASAVHAPSPTYTESVSSDTEGREADGQQNLHGKLRVTQPPCRETSCPLVMCCQTQSATCSTRTRRGSQR